jgi:hypothetical protein
LGALGIRPTPYLAEGRTGISSIGGLSLVCREFEETPIFHSQTGVYGWLRMPPGDHLIEILDPSGFRLNRRISITVPDRSAYAQSLLAGVLSPPVIPPAFIEVPLRPALGHPWMSGHTVLHGMITDTSGNSLPFARLEFDTVFKGTPEKLITHADSKGEYAAHLSGEAASFHMPDLEAGEDEDDAELISEFTRNVRLFRLKAAFASVAKSAYPLKALPLDFDTLNPLAGTSPYEPPASLIARTPEGDIAGAGPHVNVTFTAGQRRRVDFLLN